MAAAPDPDGVYLDLARRSGGSQVRIVLLDAEPPAPAGGYGYVVEVSTTIPDGARPRWVAFGDFFAPAVTGPVLAVEALVVAALLARRSGTAT